MFAAWNFGSDNSSPQDRAEVSGFLGVILIIKPGTSGFNFYSVFAMISVFFITTVSPSSLDFEERMKRIPAEPLLIAKIERNNMISEIRSFGLQVGDWKHGEAVNTALQEI